MTQFKCLECRTLFESKGEVTEYTSPVYGPCSKRVAYCPDCGEVSDEYRSPNKFRSRSASHESMPVIGGCASGSCGL